MQRHFVVKRDQLAEHRLIIAEPPALAAGEVELAIDAFGFTSNNVTYGALGDALSYWRFFPHAEAGWGRIPVWGFATVSRSRHDAVAVGERFYGYYPMSSHLVIRAAPAGEAVVVDDGEHRRPLPSLYNRYQRTTRDPMYRPDTEAEQALLRPVFSTGFLLDDWIDDEPAFADAAVVLSSASSKTASSTAFLIARRRQREVIGLTSAANEAFVRRLGVYDRVLRYDQLDGLAATRAVYLDFAGSGGLRAGVHRQLGDALIHSAAIGGTHWTERGGEAAPGVAPVVFFAPHRAAKRAQDWPHGGLVERLAAAWRDFLVPLRDPARGWLTIARSHGPDAVARVYDDAIAGRNRPDHGHLLSLA